GEVVASARIRIDVGLYVDAAFARCFDQCDELAHAFPELLVGDFQVDDVDGHASALADGNRFLDRFDHPAPFIADVRRVNTAVAACNLAQLDDVVGCGQPARRHGQHAGQSKRAVPHGRLHQGFHQFELRSGGASELGPHDALPDVIQPDIGN